MKPIIALLIATLFTFGCAKEEAKKTAAELTTRDAMTCEYFLAATESCISVGWASTLTVNTYTAANLHITSKYAAYDTVVVILTRTNGTFGSAVESYNMGNGDINLRRIYFDQTGEWQMLVSLKKNNTIVDEVVIPLSVLP